jgi:hypothetical protein
MIIIEGDVQDTLLYVEEENESVALVGVREGSVLFLEEQGIQGQKGDKGDKGDQGIQGEKGDQGDTGVKGDKGDTGDTGDPGAPGSDADASTWSQYEATQNVEMAYNGFDTVGTINISAENGINLGNGSKIHEGTRDAGYGGNGGVELECSVQYKLRWDAGRLFTMDQSNNIRQVEHQLITPNVTDDTTKGYINNSIWIHDDGRKWICIDNTEDAAFWLESDEIRENYVVIKANGNSYYNGLNLWKAYAYAKTRTPNGSALATGNRFVIKLEDGHFDMDGEFTIDTEFIDFESVSGHRVTFENAVTITANDVRVSDIDCNTYRLHIATNLDYLVIKNCRSIADFSFCGTDSEDDAFFNGYAENCDAGYAAFGYSLGNAGFNGIAKNCTAFGYSFASGGYAVFAGYAENCISPEASFGSGTSYGECGGILKNCQATIGHSFGHATDLAYFIGEAYDCIGGENCFGSADYGNCMGTLKGCKASDNSYGRGSSEGHCNSTIEYCESGANSFGYGTTGSVDGIIKYSSGGDGSFGNTRLKVSAKLYNCILSGTQFAIPGSDGRVYNCINGDGSLAIFTYAVADLPSGVLGDVAYVSDADTPLYNTVVVGGGSDFITVWFNGSNWICR